MWKRGGRCQGAEVAGVDVVGWGVEGICCWWGDCDGGRDVLS